MNEKIFIQSKGPDSWKEFLAEPDKQWRTGYSAKSLAYCWEDKTGFPAEFKSAFDSAGLFLEMLFGIPEYKVFLDSKKAPSQNDLFVLCRDSEGSAVLMIEGKVSESFDKQISEWKTNDLSRRKRLDFLIDKLEIDKAISDLDRYRYQLFHRTVSSILTAEEFKAKKALMIVHSFSKTNEWFCDYSDFVKLINPAINPQLNEIYHCKTLISDIDLYIGWIKGDVKFLEK